jgi:hypothetical protein
MPTIDCRQQNANFHSGNVVDILDEVLVRRITNISFFVLWSADRIMLNID